MSNQNRGGLKAVSIDMSRLQRYTLKFSKKCVQNLDSRSYPVRGLKQLREACFCYLNTVIVFKHEINIGLRRNFLIHFSETTLMYLSALAKDGKIRLSFKYFLDQRKKLISCPVLEFKNNLWGVMNRVGIGNRFLGSSKS